MAKNQRSDTKKRSASATDEKTPGDSGRLTQIPLPGILDQCPPRGVAPRRKAPAGDFAHTWKQLLAENARLQKELADQQATVEVLRLVAEGNSPALPAGASR